MLHVYRFIHDILYIMIICVIITNDFILEMNWKSGKKKLSVVTDKIELLFYLYFICSIFQLITQN